MSICLDCGYTDDDCCCLPPIKENNHMLNAEQIEKLASRKGVKVIAVKNFLRTLLGNTTASDARANLQLDARSYKWNAVTVKAISDGIKIHFG